MQKPRIAPVTDPSPEVAEMLSKTLARDGKPLNIFATVAHNPMVLKQFNRLGGQLLRRSSFGARAREVVILRVGWRCRSVYEFGQHTLIGLASGLSQDDVAALTHEDPGDRWSPRELDFIAAADDLCLHGEVSEPTWDRLAAQLSEAELVELVMLAGFYRLVSGSLRSFGVQLDEGVPGWPAGAEGV
jgi:alkylhydroperoxidase family enzyme